MKLIPKHQSNKGSTTISIADEIKLKMSGVDERSDHPVVQQVRQLKKLQNHVLSLPKTKLDASIERMHRRKNMTAEEKAKEDTELAIALANGLKTALEKTGDFLIDAVNTVAPPVNLALIYTIPGYGYGYGLGLLLSGDTEGAAESMAAGNLATAIWSGNPYAITLASTPYMYQTGKEYNRSPTIGNGIKFGLSIIPAANGIFEGLSKTASTVGRGVSSLNLAMSPEGFNYNGFNYKILYKPLSRLYSGFPESSTKLVKTPIQSSKIYNFAKGERPTGLGVEWMYSPITKRYAKLIDGHMEKGALTLEDAKKQGLVLPEEEIVVSQETPVKVTDSSRFNIPLFKGESYDNQRMRDWIDEFLGDPENAIKSPELYKAMLDESTSIGLAVKKIQSADRTTTNFVRDASLGLLLPASERDVLTAIAKDIELGKVPEESLWNTGTLGIDIVEDSWKLNPLGTNPAKVGGVDGYDYSHPSRFTGHSASVSNSPIVSTIKYGLRDYNAMLKFILETYGSLTRDYALSIVDEIRKRLQYKKKNYLDIVDSRTVRNFDRIPMSYLGENPELNALELANLESKLNDILSGRIKYGGHNVRGVFKVGTGPGEYNPDKTAFGALIDDNGNFDVMTDIGSWPMQLPLLKWRIGNKDLFNILNYTERLAPERLAYIENNLGKSPKLQFDYILGNNGVAPNGSIHLFPGAGGNGSGNIFGAPDGMVSVTIPRFTLRKKYGGKLNEKQRKYKIHNTRRINRD